MRLAQLCEGYLAARSPETVPSSVLARALQQDAVAARVMGKGVMPLAGDVVGIRLALNVRKSTGLAVHTVHRGSARGGHRHMRGLWGGEVVHYAQTITLARVYLNVHQRERAGIAAGTKAKSPMASADGELVSMADSADFSGVELSFNPRRSHLFVDGSNRAVRYADEVTLRANRLYARGRLVFFDATTWIEPLDGVPSSARPV